MRISKLIPWLIFGAVLIGGALAFATFFEQIPTDGNTLAMDWKGPLWTSLHDGLPYEVLGETLLNPPWSVIPLLPLGQLSMQSSWGLLSFISLLILMVSVPRIPKRWLYWVSVLALAFSFPSIRNLVDGNLEAFIVLGVLLLLYGYRRGQPVWIAVGFVFATTKPQTVALLFLTLGFYLLQNKPPRLWLMSAALVLAVVIPTMLWRGESWLTLMFAIREQGSIMDMSLMAALNRTGLFPSAFKWGAWAAVLIITGVTTWFGERSLSREKAGLLIAASLLVAPYSASTLSLLTVGVIPYFQKKRLWGGILLLLAFAQIFLNTPAAIPYYAYYSTGFLLLSWGTLLWHVWRTEIHTPAPVPVVTPSPTS